MDGIIITRYLIIAVCGLFFLGEIFLLKPRKTFCKQVSFFISQVTQFSSFCNLCCGESVESRCIEDAVRTAGSLWDA